MERIDFGGHPDNPNGDTRRLGFIKLENAVLDLEDENRELRKRLDVLEHRFKIHIRGPFAEED